MTGDLSFELYNTPIEKWSVDKSEATARLKEFAASSSLILAAIGDAAELEPLVKKHFPNFTVLKVNYKDIIGDSWLKKK